MIVSFLCYANTLNNDYSIDDELVTENQFVLKGFKGIREIWNHPYSQTGETKADFRPLTLTLFAVQNSIIGFHPFTDHFLNILLYLISLSLLFVVSLKIFELHNIHSILPFIIVLVFAVHPSHTEVVASVKNRDEILSFIWILLASLCLYRSFNVENIKTIAVYISATVLLVYLSVLTKFVSLPFMACIFLWLLYKKLYVKKIRLITLIISIITVTATHIFFFREFLLTRKITFLENPLSADKTADMVMGLGFNSLFYYLKFLIYPFPFRFYYGYNVIPFESVTQPLPLLSFFVFLFLNALLIYSILKKRNYSYFLFSFLFCLLFYSNLFTLYTGIVSERAMFQFSFFFIAFVVILIYSIIHSQNKTQKTAFYNILFSAYLLIIITFSFLTIKRNAAWKDTFTLIFNDMPYLKQSVPANILAANNCYDKSLTLQKTDTSESRNWAKLAVYYYNEAITLFPDLENTYFMLGKTYRYSLTDFNQAEKYYLLAEQKDKNLKGLARETGSLYFMKGEFNKAISYYELAVKEEPEDAELLFYQALNAYNAKEVNNFLSLNAALLKKFPDTQYPYLNYGTYYFNLNDEPKIVENFELAVQYGCDNNRVIEYLINFYIKNNNSEKAEKYKKLINRNLN